MNKPITLCDRCKEYARCCLNYDGDNCRRSRTVEPTNADRIRAMSDEELATALYLLRLDALQLEGFERTIETKEDVLEWLKEEAESEGE